MHLSNIQITELLAELANQKDGFNEVLRISFEALMKAERQEHLSGNSDDKCNGFRQVKAYGRGKMLALRVPRTRDGNFYPLLMSVLPDREEECRKIAFELYGAELTTAQVGGLFDKLYGRHYSKSSVSRMLDFAREEVMGWLLRPRETYYPIVYVDALFGVRDGAVSKEAYYTILVVKRDRTREVFVTYKKDDSLKSAETAGKTSWIPGKNDIPRSETIWISPVISLISRCGV
jgi:transposase-like protein